MKVNNHTLKNKYGVSQVTTQLIGRMMLNREVMFQLKYEDVTVKASDYQDAKVQEKKLRVFETSEALEAVILRLSKARLATSNKERKSIPILEKAFTELSMVLKQMEEEKRNER